MASSTSVAPASTPPLTLSIHTQATIRLNPPLLESLTSFLNAAFKFDFTKSSSAPRYSSPDVLAQELGSDGLCAILVEDSTESLDLPRVVASAAIIPWHGDPFEHGYNSSRSMISSDDSAKWDWKLGPVASLEGERYRGKGLVFRCINALEAILKDRMVEHMGLEALKQDITIWIQVYERVNGAYWRRRGFVEVSKREMDEGVWNSKEAFTMTTYKRVVDMNLDGGSHESVLKA